MGSGSEPKKITIPDLAARKAAGERFAMVTAYDAAFARLADASGIETLLVGDSLGMTMLGHSGTVPVTLEQMRHHTEAVARGCSRALLVSDLPFGSYEASPEDAVRSAVVLMKAGAESMKLEGGRHVAPAIRRLVDSGIPVVGHLGLTPQRASMFGGFKVQAKTAAQARVLLADALALQDAGAWAVVLECVPVPVARKVTARLTIPTIGIGAGPHCDAQVLVLHDLLGLDPSFQPRFVRRYAELGQAAREAITAFAEDVRAGRFPEDRHGFPMKDAEASDLERD